MRPQYSIITPPDFEPIGYDDASEHLRVDSTDDQKLIESLIGVAREWVDGITGRASALAQFRVVAESWTVLGNDQIKIGRTPLVSVEAVKYFPSDGGAIVTIDPSEYRVITTTEPGIVQMTGALPAVDDRPDAIQIEFTAGHAEPGLISPLHRHAIKMLVAHLYEERTPVAATELKEIPWALQGIIQNLKVGGWVA